MATGDEYNSTGARANVLREYIVRAIHGITVKFMICDCAVMQGCKWNASGGTLQNEIGVS